MLPRSVQTADSNAGRRKNARILIADDHPVVRKGLRSLLESQPGWTICAECKNGREAVLQAEVLRPDVAVLDITMPDLNGIDAGRHIQKGSPATEVLLISIHYTDELTRKILAAGIRGYILKGDPIADIVTAIEHLIQHKPYFTPCATNVLLGGPIEVQPTNEAQNAQAGQRSLTSRQREIVQLLAEGKTCKEAAFELNISVKTAETHRAQIMRKLNFTRIHELIRYAVRHKIIEP